MSETKRGLTAFYQKFFPDSAVVSKRDLRQTLSRFPFSLNKRQAKFFVNASVKEKVLVPVKGKELYEYRCFKTRTNGA